MSSKPTTATSSGTCSAASRSALIAPMAVASFAAKIAVGRVAGFAAISGHKVGSVSILSHGSDGRFALGDEWVSTKELSQTASAWEKLRKSMAPGAGIYIYGDTGTTEVPLIETRGAYAPELNELYDALVYGKPLLHSGRWGLATLEVCLAIMQSATEHRDILMQHQVAVPDGA